MRIVIGVLVGYAATLLLVIVTLGFYYDSVLKSADGGCPPGCGGWEGSSCPDPNLECAQFRESLGAALVIVTALLPFIGAGFGGVIAHRNGRKLAAQLPVEPWYQPESQSRALDATGKGNKRETEDRRG